MIIQTVSAVSLKLPTCLMHMWWWAEIEAGVTSGSDPAVLLWSASVSCSSSFVPKIAALAVICRREQLKMALSLSPWGTAVSLSLSLSPEISCSRALLCGRNAAPCACTPLARDAELYPCIPYQQRWHKIHQNVLKYKILWENVFKYKYNIMKINKIHVKLAIQ